MIHLRTCLRRYYPKRKDFVALLVRLRKWATLKGDLKYNLRLDVILKGPDGPVVTSYTI